MSFLTDIATHIKTWANGKFAVKNTSISNVTIASASWALSSGLYTYVYTNVAITATKSVQVIPRNAGAAIVKAAGILPYTLSAASQVTLYSINAPTGDFVVDMILMEVS